MHALVPSWTCQRPCEMLATTSLKGKHSWQMLCTHIIATFKASYAMVESPGSCPVSQLKQSARTHHMAHRKTARQHRSKPLLPLSSLVSMQTKSRHSARLQALGTQHVS